MNELHFIDTHCHLDFPVFDQDRDEVLLEAKRRGVNAIVVPAVVQKEWPRVIDLCRVLDSARDSAPGNSISSSDNRVQLHPALGLHPCFMGEHASVDAAEDALIEQLKKSTVVAIGEIGLDYFSGTDAKSQIKQVELFEMQLRVAKTNNLPVLLHVRKAHDDVLKRLRQLRLPRGGIVHAYSGSEQQAAQYCELGFALGFGGSTTYDRAKKLHRIIRQLPQENFVLETDAPDMPPAFAQGQLNSPINIPNIAESVALARGVSVQDIANHSTRNACRILHIDA